VVAPANPVEVIVRGWIFGMTEMLSVAFAVKAGEPASVTVKVTGELPVAVGVPEMMPLVARVSPAGNVLEDQV
jgi:uncharacterized protein YaiE (UPF0345 family)